MFVSRMHPGWVNAFLCNEHSRVELVDRLDGSSAEKNATKKRLRPYRCLSLLDLLSQWVRAEKAFTEATDTGLEG